MPETYSKYTEMESALRRVITLSQEPKVRIYSPYFRGEPEGEYGVVYRVSEVRSGEAIQEKSVVEDRKAAIFRTCQPMVSLYSVQFHGDSSLDRAADARIYLSSLDGQSELRKAGIGLMDTREIRDLFDLLPDDDSWERRAMFDFQFSWIHLDKPSRAKRVGTVRRVEWSGYVDDCTTSGIAVSGPVEAEGPQLPNRKLNYAVGLAQPEGDIIQAEFPFSVGLAQPDGTTYRVAVRPLSFQTLLLLHG